VQVYLTCKRPFNTEVLNVSLGSSDSEFLTYNLITGLYYAFMSASVFRVLLTKHRMASLGLSYRDMVICSSFAKEETTSSSLDLSQASVVGDTAEVLRLALTYLYSSLFLLDGWKCIEYILLYHLSHMCSCTCTAQDLMQTLH
jgi:hypothetical protein